MTSEFNEPYPHKIGTLPFYLINGRLSRWNTVLKIKGLLNLTHFKFHSRDCLKCLEKYEEQLKDISRITNNTYESEKT